MGLRDYDWSQLPEIPVDTRVEHGPEQESGCEVLVYNGDGQLMFGIDSKGRRIEPQSWDVHVIEALSIANGGE